jgi:thioredoxin reductase (NADPH)
LRADKIWVDKIKQFKNIEVIYNANIVEVKGNKKLEEIILDNGKELKANSLFVEAGSVPNTELIKDLRVKTNEFGYIEVEKNQATNIDGIFAAGDITTGSNGFRQVITACAEGAIAALGAFNHLKKK